MSSDLKPTVQPMKGRNAQALHGYHPFTDTLQRMMGLYRVCLFSHSSGVKHFGVQACMTAISAFKAVFTRRCRANVVFFVKSGETMVASNA